MKTNQHSILIIIFFVMIGSTLAAFPRKNRTTLQHTYVDYLNLIFCKNAPDYDPSQISTFKKDRMASNLIEVDLDKIINGNAFHSVSVKSSFFLAVLVYGGCFIGLCIIIRRLSRYNNQAIKSSIRMSQEFAIKGTNKKNLIFKVLVLALLLFSAFYSIIGLEVSQDIEKGLDKILCGFINIPNNFARIGGNQLAQANNYTTFNDYQYEAMSLRQLFKEAKSNLTDFLQYHKQNQFIEEISKRSLNLSGDQPNKFISHLIQTFELTPSLIHETKYMEASLNYLREVLYWIKGGILFGNSFLNSYYTIEKLPKLVASVVAQTYQILLLCAFGIFFTIVFMSFKSTSKQGDIVKYIILALSFSTLLCLSFSSLGAFVLPLPNQVCNILAKNQNRAALVDKITANIRFYEQSVRSTLIQLMERTSHQSDGNMAFTNPEVYRNIEKQQQQIKALLAYDNLKDVEAKIVSQFPDIEQETHAYFKNFLQTSNKMKEISLVFDKIAFSVSKQGDFGRLTLRPFGEYIQTFEHNLCDVNLSIWSKNTDNLLYCAMISLTIMLCFALYLRNKLKGDYQSANADDDHFELSAISEEKINDS